MSRKCVLLFVFVFSFISGAYSEFTENAITARDVITDTMTALKPRIQSIQLALKSLLQKVEQKLIAKLKEEIPKLWNEKVKPFLEQKAKELWEKIKPQLEALLKKGLDQVKSYIEEMVTDLIKNKLPEAVKGISSFSGNISSIPSKAVETLNPTNLLEGLGEKKNDKDAPNKEADKVDPTKLLGGIGEHKDNIGLSKLADKLNPMKISDGLGKQKDNKEAPLQQSSDNASTDNNTV